MMDLALNDNGDIMFDEYDGYNESLLLNFIISKSNSLQLNYYIDNYEHQIEENETLELNILFDIPKYNKEIETVTSEEYYEQAIKMRIETSLGSVLGNKEMGSKIESYKHRLISEKNLFERLEIEIKRSISDIMPSSTVKIEKYKTYYREFYNALKITVINKGKYYYYYL